MASCCVEASSPGRGRGRGLWGLCVALKLRAAGYTNVVLFERAPDVGGTWQANTYPGAACDAPSHIYSFSFAQDVEWSRRFAPGPEIQAYLRRCATAAGVMDRIRLNTEVTSARWSGTAWVLELADGSSEMADVLVPAVGHLCDPKLPAVPGLDTFGGPIFHSARWDHDVDLSGRRVAIVGTGASAVQIIPAIADTVAHLAVFQRSAPYVMAKPDATYGEGTHRFYRLFKPVKRAVRAAIWELFELFNYAFWRYPSAMEVLHRVHQRQLHRSIADADLRAALTPGYQIGCKRIPIDNDYYPTLTRPDVSLVTDPILEVLPEGLRTKAGVHRAEVLIFATGFQTAHFMSTLPVLGRNGIPLAELWAQRAGAFLGLSVPQFPNMFMMWGPNTNLGAGSIVYMMEAQADHIVGAVEQLARCAAGTTIEVTDIAYRKFLADLDSRQKRTIWAGCHNWYHDERGNDIHNWHGSMRSYGKRARRLDLNDYRLTTAPAALGDLAAAPG